MKKQAVRRPNSETQAPTPITNSLLANSPPGTQVDVGTISWESGFAVCVATITVFKEAVMYGKSQQPVVKDGEEWPWKAKRVEISKDHKTILRTVDELNFKTEEDARTACSIWLTAIEKRNEEIKAAETMAKQPRPSVDESDLAAARLKVMQEQYPDTFKAMGARLLALPQNRAGAVEAVFVALAVDLVRLHKPTELSEVLPFDFRPNLLSIIHDIDKAFKAKSPYDLVDAEIAARWFAAGYDTMSAEEFTKAINAKTGADLKPAAMDQRRYRKLGLELHKKPGPRPKF